MASRLAQEERVRRLLSGRLGQQLEKMTSELGRARQDGSHVLHEFDGLSDPPTYALEVKTNSITPTARELLQGRWRGCRGRFDSAIKQAIITDLFWLDLSGASRKILAITNRRLFELIDREIAPCLSDETVVLLIRGASESEDCIAVERWTSSNGQGEGFPDEHLPC